MFPVSNEALDLFQKNYRQTAEIIFYGVDNTFTITERNIVIGGLTVDRCSISGSKIELGSAIASELSLLLDNGEGQFKDVKFEGAELFVRIGVTKYDARKWEHASTQYVPLGYFTIDQPSRALTTISLSALDRMVLFDKKSQLVVVHLSNFGQGSSVADLSNLQCSSRNGHQRQTEF